MTERLVMAVAMVIVGAFLGPHLLPTLDWREKAEPLRCRVQAWHPGQLFLVLLAPCAIELALLKLFEGDVAAPLALLAHRASPFGQGQPD